ncbi:MAG: hypothetical protein JXR96_12345 [Deltaproteobacteria bacterium]|nr:hypothetical protein [Deltaproteobacteria bacterium]
MSKLLNNFLAAGLPAVVALFGLLCLLYWWRHRKELSALAGGVFAILYGLVTLFNLAIRSQGRFLGRFTWGPRYIEAESVGLVLLALAFVSLSCFVVRRGGMGLKKPLLILAALGLLVGIGLALLETFG